MDNLLTFSQVDNERANDFSIQNIFTNIGGSPIGLNTIYIDGFPVSSYAVAKKIIENESISMMDIINFLTVKKGITAYNEKYPALYSYVILEKMRKDGFTWEEGKRFIHTKLTDYVSSISEENNVNLVKENENSKKVIEKMIDLSNDENMIQKSSLNLKK